MSFIKSNWNASKFDEKIDNERESRQLDIGATLPDGRQGRIRAKVIDIGDWNMDTDFYKFITVNLLTIASSIIGVDVIIRQDDSGKFSGAFYDLNGYDWNLDLVMGGIHAMGPTGITLSRTDAGTFDNTGFDQTSYNRGWITFWYIE